MIMTPSAVSAMMTSLFGKKVAVKKTTPMDPAEVGKSMLATYLRDDGSVGALCIADVPLVAYAGAGLTMLPVGYAKEMAKTGELAENVQDNFGEILNIASRLFNSPRTPHVTLSEVKLKPVLVPPEVGAVISKPAHRVDLELSIPGYGDGRMTLIAAGPAGAK